MQILTFPTFRTLASVRDGYVTIGFDSSDNYYVLPGSDAATVTSQIQSALTFISTSTTINKLVFKPGTYSVSPSAVIGVPANTELEGVGSAIISNNNGATTCFQIQGSNVSVHGLTFSGFINSVDINSQVGAQVYMNMNQNVINQVTALSTGNSTVYPGPSSILWNAGVTYYSGCFASDGAGNLYVSLADNNTGNLVSNTTYWQLFNPAVGVYYTAIIGTAAQVLAGIAKYSSLATAVSFVAPGSSILVLSAYVTTGIPINITQEVHISGQGHGTVIEPLTISSTYVSIKDVSIGGALTIASNYASIKDSYIGGAFTISNSYTSVSHVYVAGNILINAGATGNILTGFWLNHGFTYTDNGTDTLSNGVTI